MYVQQSNFIDCDVWVWLLSVFTASNILKMFAGALRGPLSPREPSRLVFWSPMPCKVPERSCEGPTGQGGAKRGLGWQSSSKSSFVDLWWMAIFVGLPCWGSMEDMDYCPLNVPQMSLKCPLHVSSMSPFSRCNPPCHFWRLMLQRSA